MPRGRMLSPVALAVVCPALAGTLFGAPLNLLRNNSFETASTGENGQEVPRDWAPHAAWYAKPADKGLSPCTLDRAVVYGGTRALRFDGAGNRGIAWQVVRKGFNPGDRVTLKGSAKVKELERGLAWMRAEFKDSAGKILGSLAAHTPVFRTGESDWFQLEASRIVPDSTSMIQVFLCTSEPNTGYAWFDNVALLVPDAAPTRVQTAPELSAHAADASPPTTRQYVPLVPLDAFAETDVRWKSGQWGQTPQITPNTAEVVHENGEKYLHVEFLNKASFVLRKWEILGHWTALCFKARRTSGSGPVSILLRADSGHFQCRLPDLGPNWRDVALPIEGFRLDHGDRRPLTAAEDVGTIRIFAHNPMGVDLGPLYVSVPPGLSILDAYTDAMANIHEPPSAPTVKVKLLNAGERDETVQVLYELRSYRGERVAEGKQSCPMRGHSISAQTIQLPTLNAGYFTCTVRLRSAVAEIDRADMGLAILPPRPGGSPTRPFVGFSLFGIVPDLAVRLWAHRMEIQMNTYWRQLPQGNPLENAPALKLCLDNGMTPIGFFIIHPSHDRLSRKALARSPEHPDKWVYDTRVIEDYIAAVSQHFRDHIKEWSVAGEANLFSPHLAGGRDAYVQAALAAIRGIRRSVPDAKVYGIGVSGSDPYQGWEFTKYAWRTLGEHLDGVYSDNYPSGWTVQRGLRAATPESYLDTHLRHILDHIGVGKTVGVEEAGYQLDTTLPASHPLARRRAEYAARVALIAAGIPRCDEYHWYTLGRLSPKRPWGVCLTAGRHFNPYPGMATYATVARMLWDAVEPVKLSLHRDIWCYVYRKPKGSMAVVWSTASDPVSFSAETLPDLAVYDADGARLDTTDAQLSLSGSPLYLYTTIDPAQLTNALQGASYSLPPVKTAVVLDQSDRLTVLVANQTASGVSGHLEARLTLSSGRSQQASSAPFTVPTAQTVPQTIPIEPLAPERGASFTLETAFISDSGIRTQSEQQATLWPVKHLRVAPVVDARLTEYSAVRPIVLDTADFICPPDAVGVHRLWTSPDDLSITAWTAWDEHCFYLAAEVTDKAHCQQFTGSSIWRNDTLHIGFDMLNDTLAPDFSGTGGHDGRNDFELGLALTEKGPQVYEWTSGDQPSRGVLRNAQLAIRREGQKTLYEFAMPWQELGGYEPTPGRIIGFGFVVMNSNDGETAPYWLQFTGGICGGKDPSRYADFVLTTE